MGSVIAQTTVPGTEPNGDRHHIPANSLTPMIVPSVVVKCRT
jgi:hypothetical protein